jgi:hypothetical protein
MVKLLSTALPLIDVGISNPLLATNKVTPTLLLEVLT